MWVGGTVGPLCPLGPDLPVRPCRNQADALFFTDCTATHRICDLVSFSDTVLSPSTCQKVTSKSTISFIPTLVPFSPLEPGNPGNPRDPLKRKNRSHRHAFTLKMTASTNISYESEFPWPLVLVFQDIQEVLEHPVYPAITWQHKTMTDGERCSHSLRCKHRNHSYIIWILLCHCIVEMKYP